MSVTMYAAAHPGGRIVEQAPLVVMWPRFPATTPTGRESHAKNVNHLVPWLSTNVVNNLAKFEYRRYVGIWRNAAEAAARDQLAEGAEVRELDHRILLLATLYRATAAPMDPFSVLEGLKPVVDGMVCAGALRADTEEFVAGGIPRCRKAETRDACRLELRWRAV